MARHAVLVLMALATQGCGGVYGVTHCDFQKEGHGRRCQEREGAGGVAFSLLCEQSKGVSGDGQCPREGIVAGCQGATNPAQKVTDWYYTFPSTGTDNVTTSDDVKRICDDDGDTLVNP